jgi:molecular chaperone HscB
MLAAHFCSACGRVQPPYPTDYFSFFGLPPKLNIDLAALEREMYHLSRKLHPDMYVRTSPQEQAWSLEQSSQLNDAYRTLRDPVSRTEYLLRLEGVQLEEQSKNATEKARSSGREKAQAVPPDLLEEVFELNLQLEELRLNWKAGEEDPYLVQDLKSAKEGLESRLEGLLQELKSCWDEWDAMISRAQAGEQIPAEERRRRRDKMVDLLNRRSYIKNLVRDVTAALAV